MSAAERVGEGQGGRFEDIEAKQIRVARLLEETECEGLLVVEPANFRWLTAGGTFPGLHAPGERPALFFNQRQRWLICANTDTQRLFDEEIDELGFQLKEWPWHGQRERLIGEILHNRRVAADHPIGECELIRDQLRRERRFLTPYEQGQYAKLGGLLAHALEATARNCARGDSEEELAGQLGHRLIHRGAEPAVIQVLADDRGRAYRRGAYGPTAADKRATLMATAGVGGLYTTASRTVVFEDSGDDFPEEYDAAQRVSAASMAAASPDSPVAAALEAGRAELAGTTSEHEWRLAAAGYRTGRLPAESVLGAFEGEKFRAGQAVVWQSWVGGALVCDTQLIGPTGARDVVTAVENWPTRRVQIGDLAVVRPGVLRRSK